MSEKRTTAKAFHDAAGVEDWRVLFSGAHAHFRVGSFAEAARFVAAIAEIAELVARDLEQVGLKGTENKMPDELSGGMRKRMAIARALVVEPQLILYDEPTSELDPVSAVNIAEEIVKLNQRIHVTTLIVSHDRDLAFGIAHRIAMLDEGRIVAIGTPDEIKRNPDPRVQQFLNAKIAPESAVSANLQPVIPILV